MPTVPPTVVKGPVTSGWMSHQSSELQPWTWAQTREGAERGGHGDGHGGAGEEAPGRLLAQERRDGQQQEAADQQDQQREQRRPVDRGAGHVELLGHGRDRGGGLGGHLGEEGEDHGATSWLVGCAVAACSPSAPASPSWTSIGPELASRSGCVGSSKPVDLLLHAGEDAVDRRLDAVEHRLRVDAEEDDQHEQRHHDEALGELQVGERGVVLVGLAVERPAGRPRAGRGRR